MPFSGLPFLLSYTASTFEDICTLIPFIDVGESGYPSALIENNDTILEQPIYLPELTSRCIAAANHFIKRSVGQKLYFIIVFFYCLIYTQ